MQNKLTDKPVIGTTGDRDGSDVDNIYLDLETILDLRMGTLAQMDSDKAIQILDSGLYHKRFTDIFPGVNTERYKAAYAKRDIETLKHSVLTNMVFFLRRLIKDSLMSAVLQEKVEKMCFTVNVYPFDFEDPGLVEMLIGCIRFHTYSAATVEIVSYSNEELTPSFCNQSYQIMIRYDWMSWLNCHKEFFETKGIPQLTIVAPEMFSAAAPTKEEINNLGLKKINPFEETVRALAPLFRLKHMPVSLFSIHEAITKKTAKAALARVQVTQKDIEDYLNKSHPKATLVRDNPLPIPDLDESFQLL